MPNYTPSAAGVELRVTNNGRPQGKGPLTQADINSAIDFESGGQSNIAAVPPVAGGSPALPRYYRIDTIAVAGNNDSQVHPDTGPFLVTDMKVLRTAGGNVGDTWQLEVQRQGAGAFLPVFPAASFTASATEAGAGDYVARVVGTPMTIANQRIVGGDVLRLVTINGGANNSSAQCYIECAGVL
jgi:hypothetical protein